jgi:Uma2 family endonuclease
VPDGATVRIDDATAYEPDAMVYCGPQPPPSALLVENPVIIVEVLSPSTGWRDQGRKLADYFRLPSVAHYLIIDPDEVLVIHHQRRGDDILTRILRDGTIALDPPGIEVKVAEIYGVGA